MQRNEHFIREIEWNGTECISVLGFRFILGLRLQVERNKFSLEIIFTGVHICKLPPFRKN